jgi:thiol-disulfide isomerase/thioredoxin
VPYVVSALVLVGGIALLNLLLTLGLIRRMREQANALSALVGGLTPPPYDDESMRSVGSAVEPFHAQAVDGSPIDTGWFDRPTLVGFFSPGCQPCTELLPRFVAAATDMRALAVIEPGPLDDSDYRAALADHATVVVGEPARAVIAAFGVQGFPAVCRVDGAGVITATGTRLVDATVGGASRPVGV